MEYANILPEEGPDGELVELAPYEAQEMRMRDGMSTGHINAAIAHVIPTPPNRL